MTGEAAGLAMGLCELGGKSVSDIGDTKAPSSPEPPGLPVEREQGLSTSDLNIRQAVAQPVHSLLQEHIQGCTMRLYDSSLGGFGLKFANVNLELQITVNRKLRLVLQKRLNV